MELFTLFGKFTTNAKDAEKEIDEVTGKAKGAESKWSSSFGSIAKTALGFGGKISGLATTVMGSMGMVYDSQMETLSASFETMLGSADKANAHMNDLKAFAAKTPFELGDLANASKTLMSFGVDTQKIMPDIKMLGDISQGNKEKFNSLSLVFGQVASQGKLMGGDLLQMINAGFNPLQEISKKTGKSMSELKDEMSKGQITYDMVSDAMKSATSEGGMFNGAMEKQSHTMSGLLSTLKDNLGSLAGKATQPIFDWIKSGIEGFLPKLDTASQDLGTFFDKLKSGEDIGQAFKDSFSNLFGESGANSIGNVLQGIKDGFGWIIEHKDELITGLVGIATAIGVFKTITFITSIVDAFKAWKTATEGVTIAQQLLNLVMEANPFGIVVAAISGLVAGLIYLWNTNEGFRDAVINAWNAVVDFFTTTIPTWWNNTMTWLQGVWDSLIQWFADLWTNIGQAFQTGWQAIVDFFTVTIPQWIDNIGNWFNQLPGKIGEALGFALGSIIQWGIDTWNYLVTNVPIWIQGIGDWFAQLPGVIWNWLTNVISNVASWGSDMFNKAVETGQNFINGIIDWFSQLPGRIWDWLTSTISNIGSFVSDMGSKAVEAGQSFLDGIVNTVSQIPGKMLSIGGDIVQGIWNGISGAGGWLWSKVTDFAGGIVKGMKSALGIHSPSTVLRDEVGKYMAQGVGVGFTDEMHNVKDDMSTSMASLAGSDMVKSFNNNLTVNQGNVNQQAQSVEQQPIVIQIDGREVFRALSPKMAMAGMGVR